MSDNELIIKIESFSETAKKYLAKYCAGETLYIEQHREGQLGETLKWFVNGEEVCQQDFHLITTTPWIPEMGQTKSENIDGNIWTWGNTFYKHPSRPFLKDSPAYKVVID